MAADLGGPAGRDDGGHGDEAAITWLEFGAFPDFAEKDIVGEIAEAGRDVVDGRRSDTAPFFLCLCAGCGKRGHGDAGDDILHLWFLFMAPLSSPDPDRPTSSGSSRFQ